jgi:hypothetical protein
VAREQRGRCRRGAKRSFRPSWPVEETDSSLIVKDANGITLAVINYWDGLGQWAFSSKHLTQKHETISLHAFRPKFGFLSAIACWL